MPPTTGNSKPFTICAALGYLMIFAIFGTAACDDATAPHAKPEFEIIADPAELPAAVARTRNAILAAARLGDVVALNRVLQTSELKPILGPKPVRDPAAYWKEQSADGKGHALLAALINVLEAKCARTGKGADDETYIWPYFDLAPLDALSPAQRVELFRLAEPESVKQMIAKKAYTHYRVAIGRDGTWHAFSKRP